MVAHVRTTLQTLTAAQKWVAALSGMGVTATGIILFLSGYVGLPTRTDDLEVRVVRLEESDRFSLCWMLEFGAGRDPNVCRYLLQNPDEFRPPYTPIQ